MIRKMLRLFENKDVKSISSMNSYSPLLVVLFILFQYLFNFFHTITLAIFNYLGIELMKERVSIMFEMHLIM